MNRFIPDVNILVALLWSRHQAHAVAHRWFSSLGRGKWATNAITQLGVLRLLTNPAITRGMVDASLALESLSEVCSHPAHEFWPLVDAPGEALNRFSERIRGHGQWTDALLLAQAIERGGTLVTFDSGIARLAGKEFEKHLLVLKQSSPF